MPPRRKSPKAKEVDTEPKKRGIKKGKKEVKNKVIEESSPVGPPLSESLPVGSSLSQSSPVGSPLSQSSPVGSSLSRASPVGSPLSKSLSLGSPSSSARRGSQASSKRTSSQKSSSDPEMDEDVKTIEVPWYKDQNVVIIDTIGDGSCFIHSLLTAVDPEYQDNDDLSYRKEVAKDIRKNLSVHLALPAKDEDGNKMEVTDDILEQRDKLEYLEDVRNPLTKKKFKNNYKYIINYEYALDGSFPRLYEQEKEGDEEFTGPDDEPIDYSLHGLQKLFNSKNWLGDEIFAYIGNMFGVTIYIVQQSRKKKKDNLDYISDTRKEENDKRPAIVIMGNGVHFEVVAVETDKGYQTIFKYNHPFIKVLNKSRQTKK